MSEEKKDGGLLTEEKLKVYGYTIEQIRDLDRWRHQYNINPDLIGQTYKQGFEAGVKMAREQMQQALEDQMTMIRQRDL